ncbi:uncharacterized protein LOC132274959 [Cornus florida]|uniref:uncharacterized protein LOC132274959 n=1 Tax=Cornus florida TaxID=4283 RepID=UPI0028970B67|nr:uncharacterized protein LOC132274959 [Cornus florida]
MGCFLACFGYSKKRKKPRKPSSKILSGGDQRHGSYLPLDSVVATKPEFNNKGKEGSSLRIRKKVSFNLNVKSYEPIPNDETSYFWDEEEECEKNGGETATESAPLFLSKRDSMGSKMGSYPLNYRYVNCRDSYEEEDNIELEEDDLDEDEDEDEGSGGSDYGDDRETIQEFSTQFCSLSMESQKMVTSTQLADDKAASLDQGLKKVERNRIARDRSQYVHSVLNPVENLSQWKAVKARTTLPLKHQSKENLTLEQQQQLPTILKPIVNSSSPFNYKPDFSQSKPLVQGIAVDASLSNWLVSSGTGSITNTCSVPVVAVSSKKNMLEDQVHQSKERYNFPQLSKLLG